MNMYKITYSLGICNIDAKLFNHISGFLLFLKGYYLPILLQCIVFLIITNKKNFKNILYSKNIVYLIYFSFVFFELFLCTLFFYDFYNNGNSIGSLGQWLKSRLLEPLFYAVIFNNLCIIYSLAKNTLLSKLTTILLIINSLIVCFSFKTGFIWHVIIGLCMLF